MTPVRRVRPSDLEWPSVSQWDALSAQVDGQLSRLRSPLAACESASDAADCAATLTNLKNPYFIRDQAALTQTLGWVDAWTSVPSVYAVAAKNTRHVVAAVNFAREHKLRLVIKGGGHSYQGTSCAPDSLLLWTRGLDAVVMHDAFVPTGCADVQAPQPAVTVGAGAIWMHVYNAVTTKVGRYVQGGGCGTVGVAGLVQSGGFGSFSKRYGTAAASLLEAEVVTADGVVRIANACTHPDLFWALKGGGGGTFGVVTNLTLRTHDLANYFGGAFVAIKANSDTTFRGLIRRFVGFYSKTLFNPSWGEKVAFDSDNTLRVGMVFQGLDREQALAVWRPFLDELAASPDEFTITPAPMIAAIPARSFWDPKFLKQNLSTLVVSDSRPGAPEDNVYWRGDADQVAQYIYGYRSAWLPATLLEPDRQVELAEAIFAATRHWSVALHFNKGLAGASKDAIAASRDTATNPVVLDAFALAICAGEGSLLHPALPDRLPDSALARRRAAAIRRAMDELLKVAPNVGSYVSESDFFESQWQTSFWGKNYPQLRAVKQRYDAGGLFVVHHGVGSEEWSPDGFTRLA